MLLSLRLATCLCLSAIPLIACASWWQDAKDKVHEISEAVESRFESGPVFTPAPALVESDPLVAFARDRNWRLDFVAEPVFNSEIALLDSGEQDKPALLLVHGLGANAAADWLPLLDRLAAGYRVLALDLPGFGRSAQPAGDYSPANYARVLHWVSADRGLVPHLVGHSMGGAIALYAAASKPEAFASLAVIDAAGILERTAFVKALATGPIPLDKLPEQIKSHGYSAVDFAGALIERVSLLGDPSLVLSQAQLRELALGKTPTAKAALALAQTDFSVLPAELPLAFSILWGSDDTVAPLRTGHTLRARYPAASLSVIPGAAHVPMASHGEQVADWLLASVAGTEWDNPFLWRANLPTLTSGPDRRLKNCPQEPLTGAYGELRVEGCSLLEIRDARIQRLVVTDSLVLLDNVHIEGAGQALVARESVLIATGLQVTTGEPLHITGSRLDWAGVKITSPGPAFSVDKKSLFVFSLSESHVAQQTKPLHGSFRLEQRQF